MAGDLVFPDGVRLARLEEMPLSMPDRDEAWSRIQSADIRSGFVVFESADPRFPFYAEANVDAHKIWSVFCDLCKQLLGPSGTLLMSEKDEEPAAVGTNEVSLILRYLEPHRYQLAHDGFIQFGLIHQHGSKASEVFVAPAKHFELWFGDAGAVKAIMRQYGVPEVEALQFIDQYPRITTALPIEKTTFESAQQLVSRLEKALARQGTLH